MNLMRSRAAEVVARGPWALHSMFDDSIRLGASLSAAGRSQVGVSALTWIWSGQNESGRREVTQEPNS